MRASIINPRWFDVPGRFPTRVRMMQTRVLVSNRYSINTGYELIKTSLWLNILQIAEELSELHIENIGYVQLPNNSAAWQRAEIRPNYKLPQLQNEGSCS